MIDAHKLKPVSTRSIIIAGFSTVVEWYDFTLYIYFATVLSRVFYGGGQASLVTTLAGFAIAYLMRPLGAFFFGHIGYRLGRRHTLLLSMSIMTAAMLAMALLPTAMQIGPVAGILLFILRCLMGFAVGGEYTGVVAYLLESAPSNRRGLIASLAAAASEVGALMAVGVSALTVHLVPSLALDTWGWRVPFFVGAALAGVVWIARSSLHESPEFERQRTLGTVPSNPLIYTLKHNFRGVFRGFAISALGSITYYVGIGYVPAFITSAGLLPESQALWLSTIAAVIVILITPFVGALSDRLGRKPVLIGLAITSAIMPVAMFSLMSSASFWQVLTGAVILAAIAGGVSAVGAVTTAEQFPSEGRLSGLALGATVATAIFGGLTPWMAQVLIDKTHLPIIPGIMIMVVSIFVLPVLFTLSKTSNKLDL